MSNNNSLGNTLEPGVDIYNKYNPFRRPENVEPLVKGIPVMFMTTPSLYLNKSNIGGDSYLSYCYDHEPEVLKCLSYGGDFNDIKKVTSASPFIKIFTNKFKSINTKDTQLKTKELYETYYGVRQMFPASIVDSIVSDEISIKYDETKNLDIIKRHKAWIEYTELLRRGEIKPLPDSIKKRYLDFTSSIYYFLLDFDMETILYYSKYTGVVPVNVPYSSLSGDITDTNFPYKDFIASYEASK